MTPQSLLIEEFELRFMQELSPFVPSPRAAKRFVNIYRLIRASIEKNQLKEFVGTQEAPGTHRAALLLLAILTGYPAQASALLPSILDLPDGHSWWDLVETLRPIPAASPSGVRTSNGVQEDLNERDALAWSELTKRLALLKSLEPSGIPDTLQPYREWAPAVARFSFQAGRAVGADRLTSVAGSVPIQAVVQTASEESAGLPQ